MRKITLSIVAIIGMSSFGFAGGDIEPAPMIEDESDYSSFYIGAGFVDVSARDASLSMDFLNSETGQDRLGNLTFLVGYNFNQYIAIESRYSTTFTDEDLVEVDVWSLFAKPQYPIYENLSLYALIGFGGVNMDSINGSGVDVDDNTFQWGIGIDYDMVEHLSLFVDYTSLANNMDGVYTNGAVQADADAITLGITYQF